MSYKTAKKSTVHFVVGITGHRHIPAEYIPPLQEKVGELLRNLQAGFPFGEIVVLSALAKGADTLCAEAAIETGCTLIAPLPLTVEEYRKDFDANALPVFERLLAAANDYFPIPSAKTDRQAVPRTYFYSQLGHYIISHCHLLLALWDGDERDIQPGGTADVVRMALEGLSAKTLDKAPLSVIQLVTPKEGAELPQNLLTFNRIPEGRKI